MYIASLDADGGSSCIEIFIFKFSDSASVKCIGVFSAESGNIEFHNPAPDLLIRGKSYLYVAMSEFRVFHDVLYSIHDFCYTGLVVSSKEGRSVGGDECLTFILKHFREFRWLEAQSFDTFQGDFPSVIIFDDLWLYIFSGCIRGCICMSYKTDGRYLFTAV